MFLDSFMIEHVSSSDYYLDWIYSDNYIYDEDNNLLGIREVLVVESDRHISDDAILKRLKIRFHEKEIVYDVKKVGDNSDYKAVIQATNTLNGLTKNIYVKIWKY